ncbi:hypothetical protein [Enterococcus innesii]|uniref:hypothetical protein n=1 Tax=Enterococcus innesii TaxID=2839759 RepID=UPI0034A38137
MQDKLLELLADEHSYPYVFMYGSDGTGGLWKSRNVPAKYSNNFMDSLPIAEENPTAYATVEKYVGNVIQYVQEKRVGLFFFSKPCPENKFGTGTGKTTAAITILNHYLLERLRQHLKNERSIEDNPVYFCKSTDLQTAFNAQFRGSADMQRTASERYYAIKNRVKTVELLVFDDIATKASTESYTEELYEIIDHRATEELATIYTSNMTMEAVADLLGDRIASRIEGMTVPVAFTGRDYRRKVL